MHCEDLNSIITLRKASHDSCTHSMYIDHLVIEELQ